jgi:radical SAM superfamily enzyme YgiQ (UPF0313 family)
MKVLFVYPDLSKGAQGKFYHGIAYLSAVLKKAGHKTSLLHITSPIAEKDFGDALSNESPDLVAFSSTTNMFSYVTKWASVTKKVLKVPIICGGIHATLVPEEVIADESIDMLCVGEGEEAIVDLCENLTKGNDIYRIPNIWAKKNGTVFKNPVRPLIQDLDVLPFPDRSIFKYEQLIDAQLNRHVFMAARGCPYNCSYCCNHSIRKIYEDKKYARFRSVNNLIDEIKQVINNQPARLIAFHDDLFTMDERWLFEFARKYEHNIRLPFICNSRVGILDEERIIALKKAGCIQIELGVESGNPEIRKNILNRDMSDKDIIQTFDLCRRYEIKTLVYNMVGIPFETINNILETIKLNARLRPDDIQVSIFYPYPQTRLYDICKNNNMLTSQTKGSYFEGSILFQPQITKEEILFAFRNFDFLVKLFIIVYKFPNLCLFVFEAIVAKLFLIKSQIIQVFNQPIVVSALMHLGKGGYAGLFRIIKSKFYVVKKL